ncbi:O-antigen ligase family protein [Pannonibacter phragmitetus]|uniref:O-antigen ligase family protein n=1 Tax=Pannonibacter phragmitetus TaxID=121719 RepID=UPI003D2F2B61
MVSNNPVTDSPIGMGPPAEVVEDIDNAAFATDVNVMTRIEEYRIALDLFHAQPVTGAGLGIRHEIVFETARGEKLIQNVGYVHNWVFYFLMVGGLIGTALYGALMTVPPTMVGIRLWLARKMPDRERFSEMVLMFNAVWVGLLTMGLYSLFFAVFRLISYNLLMAAGLGISAHIFTTLRKRAS